MKRKVQNTGILGHALDIGGSSRAYSSSRSELGCLLLSSSIVIKRGSDHVHMLSCFTECMQQKKVCE